MNKRALIFLALLAALVTFTSVILAEPSTQTYTETPLPSSTLTPTPTPNIWVYWTLPTEISPTQQAVAIEYKFTGGGLLIAVVMFGNFVILFMIASRQRQNNSAARRRDGENSDNVF